MRYLAISHSLLGAGTFTMTITTAKFHVYREYNKGDPTGGALHRIMEIEIRFYHLLCRTKKRMKTQLSEPVNWREESVCMCCIARD